MAVVEKARMDKKEEECLQTHIIDIEETVEAKDVTAKLYAEKIINREDKEKIEAGDTRKERTKRLTDIIVWRGSRSFTVFIKALEASGYKELALKLFSNIAKLEDPAGSVKDSLSAKFESLRERVDVIESGVTKRSLASKSEYKNLSAEIRAISLQVKGLSSTLQKIEELSTASKATEVTLATLRRQLEEKKQLIQAARDRIDDLESKLDDMEAENALQRSDLKRQGKQIQTLKKEVEDERLRGDRIQKDAREEKRKTEAMFQKQGEQIEQMLKTQEATMVKVKELEGQQGANGKQKKNSNKKQLVPKHRFQDKRK